MFQLLQWYNETILVRIGAVYVSFWFGAGVELLLEGAKIVNFLQTTLVTYTCWGAFSHFTKLLCSQPPYLTIAG